ncbi:MAG: DUF1819 domain-containing protein [Myxococcales bacterium]
MSLTAAMVAADRWTRRAHSGELQSRSGGLQSRDGARTESTTTHARILRCTLAVADSQAYWQHADLDLVWAARSRRAFEGRWFGVRSEARVCTLIAEMAARFDAFPEALALLHELGTVPSNLRPYLCHVHTQLADPIYRRFTGEMLPTRRAHGQTTIDRDVVARWVANLEPGRWSVATCAKFASNLLATTAEAGLVLGQQDPRKLMLHAVPERVLGYVLYVLRGVRIQGSLDNNPYLRSLGIDPESFGRLGTCVPGVCVTELGRVIDVTWLEPNLRSWGLRYLGGGG